MSSNNKFDANSWDSLYGESTKKIKYEDDVTHDETTYEQENDNAENVLPVNSAFVIDSMPKEQKTVNTDDGKNKRIIKIILISVLSVVLLAGLIVAGIYLSDYFGVSDPLGGHDGTNQEDEIDTQNNNVNVDDESTDGYKDDFTEWPSDNSGEDNELDPTADNWQGVENSEVNNPTDSDENDEESVSEEWTSSDSVSDVLLEDTHVYLNNMIWSASRESYDLVSGVEFVEGGEPDFGDGTSILNRIIKTVDKNASLDTVLMGNFGEEYLEYSVVNGKYHNDKAKYALRTATLTENDIKYEERDEECCVVILKDCTNPKKDYDNPLHRVTDNFVTEEEIIDYYAVNYGVTVSSARLKYHNIIVQIESVDDETVISIAYEVSTTIKFNVSGMTITGSCELFSGTSYTVY